MTTTDRPDWQLTADELAFRHEHRKARAAANTANGPDPLDVARVDLSGFTSRFPSGPLAQALLAMSDPEKRRELERIQREEDIAAVEEIKANKAKNRYASFSSTRPEDYRSASYADFDPKNPTHVLCKGWWRSGSLNLVIVGHAGRGKTHLSWAIANEVAFNDREGGRLPVSVRGFTAGQIRDILEPASPHEARDEVLSKKRAREERALYEADLLLIDDLTATNVTEWFRTAIHRILDVRVSNGRRTIVTMNAPDSENAAKHMEDRFGSAIVSRLRHEGVFTWLTGTDRRTGTSWNPFA